MYIARVMTAKQQGKLVEDGTGGLIAADLQTAVELQGSFEDAAARFPALGELLSPVRAPETIPTRPQ
jgi:hypothetical protein